MTKRKYNPDSKSWSIMTVTNGGTVSRIGDLTLREAVQMYNRLNPHYGRHATSYCVHKDYLPSGFSGMSGGGGGFAFQVDNSTMKVIEVFGPEGWPGIHSENIENWPKYDTVWTDDKGNILPEDLQENGRAKALARQQASRKKAEKYMEDLSIKVTTGSPDVSAPKFTERPAKNFIVRIFDSSFWTGSDK